MTPARPKARLPAGHRPASRLAVRERLRALLPGSAEPVEGQEPAGRRGLAMLLSLVVALVMWFSFSMRETYSTTLRVPVEVVRTPPGQSLREAPPASATVTLQGEGWTLLSLSRTDPVIRVYADGSRVDLAAALQESGLPAGVLVQSVQPQAVELALDVQTSRQLPIRLRRDIRTEPAYDLLRPPQLDPDSVVVTGAQSLLGGLDEWPTEVLRAENVSQSLTRTVALADTFGGLLSPSAQTTRVRVDVGEYTEDARDLEVEVENLPPDVLGVRFDPVRVRATFRVPVQGETFGRAETTPEFRAVVDYFDIARDTTDGVVPVSARWPADLDIRDVTLSPARVEYFIRRPARPLGEARGPGR